MGRSGETPRAEGAGSTDHVPVLLEETVEFLVENAPGTFVDGTAGGGGHLQAVLARLPAEARVLAMDRDPAALARVQRRVGEDSRLVLRQGAFDRVGDVLARLGFPPVEAALFDLGMSTDQLEDDGRGFSYRRQAPLDMRFDSSGGTTADELVNRLPQNELADLIYELGGERRSRRIARRIVQRRPIADTSELTSAVSSAVRGYRPGVLSRVFQALRIAVNDEMGQLRRLLDSMSGWMSTGGRVGVITFHSLEDRMVKLFFRDGEDFRPGEPPWTGPSRDEQKSNVRSRSAKLRRGVRL